MFTAGRRRCAFRRRQGYRPCNCGLRQLWRCGQEVAIMGTWLQGVLASSPPKRSKRHSTAERVAEYLAIHQADFGPPGAGTCPVCGHGGCFGRNHTDPLRWYCFSAGHGAVLGADGKPVGRKGSKGFMGDVLDIHAFAAGNGRLDHLREGSRARVASRSTTPKSGPLWSREDLHELFEERFAIRTLDGQIPEPVARALARMDALKIARLSEWPGQEKPD